MDIMVNWMENTPLAQWVVSVAMLWPILEIFHFLGLSLLLGSMLIVDLRLLGFFPSISITTTHKLLPWAFAGFGFNLITGVLFLFGDPSRYVYHTGFQLKMVLVLIAGLNALLFYWKIKPAMHSWGYQSPPTRLARIVAFLSLLVWFSVLVLGRLIPYVSTGTG